MSNCVVQGIPTLVLLDKTGNLVTDDGRTGVSEDPEGKNFPWRPVPFEDAFYKNEQCFLLDKSGGKVAASSVLVCFLCLRT